LTEQAVEHEATIIFAQHDFPLWPPSLARNICFRRLQSELVATVDADAVLHPKTLEAASTLLASEKNAAVRVQTKLIPYKSDHAMFRNLSPASFEKNVQIGETARGPGCCLVTKTRDVEAVRGWNEQYVGHGVADWDFVCRLKMHGLRWISLSAVDGLWSMHQDHERHIDKNAVQKNLDTFFSTDMKVSPVRNPETWGGFPSAWGQSVFGKQPELSLHVNSLSVDHLRRKLDELQSELSTKEFSRVVVSFEVDPAKKEYPYEFAEVCRSYDVPIRMVER